MQKRGHILVTKKLIPLCMKHRNWVIFGSICPDLLLHTFIKGHTYQAKHDRVNYAVTEAKLKVNPEKKVIALNLQVDESICTMYEYFEIFLGRMMMCRGAAEILGARFKLTANGQKVL